MPAAELLQVGGLGVDEEAVDGGDVEILDEAEVHSHPDAGEEVERFFAADGLVPDLVVVLDVDDATAEQRRSPSADRMEREGGAFHEQVRRAYRRLAAANGWTVIDGAGEPRVVAARVRAAVEPLMNAQSTPS